ncbi:nucleoside triphosphate pyrophosphohydrolase [Paenibacillus agaridevorans]|uniref:nucleoside triphosphate pyrophosphohydrolase n=1 Tax=Paenibacillus agaridevorans TaxID=171404 RepID=UPI001BE3FDD8|nr:nucleoside triphosphate pyrophosphohydrolase [Paenibacillus agaridevorans]
MPTYNKLVRDHIPQIIEETGKTCRTRILNDEEYLQELNTKLMEEVNEYLGAKNANEALEELADVLEVIRALTAAHGYSVEEGEELRKQKTEKRGGFQERVYLIDVDDEA